MLSIGWARPMTRRGRDVDSASCILLEIKLRLGVYFIRTNVRMSRTTSVFMGTTSTATRVSARRHRAVSAPVTRYDRRLAEILTHATDVFCKKGYEGASMRDLSRASGMSLAGLYYYFESKERLLFLIQKHTFTTIVQRLKERLEGVADSEDRIRILILNHLEYFLNNQPAMKVLTHEDDALKNGFGSEIAAIKREYYRLCVGLLEDLKKDRGLQISTRTAVMSLFGMMNWIYTWHNPRVDADAEQLAREMAEIFLSGVITGGKGRRDGR